MMLNPIVAVGRIWIDVDLELSTFLHDTRSIANGIFGYSDRNERRNRPGPWRILQDTLTIKYDRV